MNVNFAIGIFVIVILFTIAIIALLVIEDRDKRIRKEKGLPPKKYHDISDYDVTTVYTIRHK